MKKILLLAAASVAALAANAAGFNGNLTASVDGTEIVNGAVIKISEYEDFEAIVPGMGYNYAANIVVTNKTASPIANKIQISYTGNPSEAEALANPLAWGSLQICCFGPVEGDNCLQELDLEKTVKANASMTWQFDNTGVSPTEGKPNRTYHVVLSSEGTSLSFDIVFNPQGNGVEEAVTDFGAAEYYNLQGQRVANPEKGLYIVKQNGKTQKMVIR